MKKLSTRQKVFVVIACLAGIGLVQEAIHPSTDANGFDTSDTCVQTWNTHHLDPSWPGPYRQTEAEYVSVCHQTGQWITQVSQP